MFWRRGKNGARFFNHNESPRAARAEVALRQKLWYTIFCYLLRGELAMKKLSLFVLCLPLAGGAAGGDFFTRVPVLETSPVIETVYEPYESCGYQKRTRRQRGAGNTGEKVIGGLVGGGVGSAFGSGSGRDIAAGIGALAGSEIADGDGLTEGELIGGLVGGIVGNQVGKGKGKTAATGAGTLLGAIVGDNLQNGGEQRISTRRIRVCEERERAKKVITGYKVVYEYGGVRQTGVLPYEPGEYVDIQIAVSLVENRTLQTDETDG